MVEEEVKIVNKLGLHARAAAKFVTTAASFESEIQLGKGEHWVNGKSIMGIMMLAAGKGTTLKLRVDGPDEDTAHAKLKQLIADRFGEPE